MLKKFVATFLCAACAVLALTSCGNSKAAGTGEFATVQVSATPPPAKVESDVTHWEGTACQSVGQTVADDVDFTVTSTAFPTANTGQTNTITPSPIKIRKITVSYRPVNPAEAPALPIEVNPQFSSAGQIINAGTTTTVSVTIASLQLKNFLKSSLGTQSLNCSNPGAAYTYYVDVSFEAVEINTDRVSTFTANGLQVTFSDFTD